VARDKLTVRELAERFLGEYSSPRVKDVPRYRKMVGYIFRKHLYAAFGAVRASELTRVRLGRWRDELLAGGLSKHSVKHLLAYTSRMFNWARAEGLVTCANPVALVDKPSLADREGFDYLSRDEIERLLAWSEEHQPGEHALYATALYSGMRMGECYGLRWSDLNLDTGLLSVRRSYRSSPKSGKARHIPINPHLAPVLRLWRERCPASPEGLVFPSKRGAMRDKDRDYGFKAALAGARCHDIGGFHGLRHTIASHFMMARGNILTLQRLLGHSSVAVTMKYAHLAPDFMREEIGRMSFAARTAAGISPLALVAP
jgi:integrase